MLAWDGQVKAPAPAIYLGSALGSHIFPTAEAQIEQPSGGLKTWGGGVVGGGSGCRGRGSS